MCRIARLIIVNRAKPSVADTTLTAHSPQPCPITAAQGSIGIAWVCSGGGIFHKSPGSIQNNNPGGAQAKTVLAKYIDPLRPAGAATQKPQGGFPFLTASDGSIIA